MPSKAHIDPSIGRAFITGEDSSIFLLDYDNPQPKKISEEEMIGRMTSRIYLEAQDAGEYPYCKLHEQLVTQKLRLDAIQHLNFCVSPIIEDPEERKKLADNLEEKLSNPEVKEAVREYLATHEFPEDCVFHYLPVTGHIGELIKAIYPDSQ